MPSHHHSSASSSHHHSSSSRRKHSGDDHGSNKAPRREEERSGPVPLTILGMWYSVQPPASIDVGKKFPWEVVATVQHNKDKQVWYTAELIAKNTTTGQRVQLATVQSLGDSTNYMAASLPDRRDDLDYLIFKDIAIPESLVGKCELTVKVMRNNMTGGSYQGILVSDKFTVTKRGKSGAQTLSSSQERFIDGLISRGYIR